MNTASVCVCVWGGGRMWMFGWVVLLHVGLEIFMFRIMYNRCPGEGLVTFAIKTVA